MPRRPASEFPDRMTLCLDMDDTLTLMTFDKIKDETSGQYIPFDATVSAQENPSDWGMVYFRPYLRSFLESVSQAFEVVVFTAACQEYADQILDAIDPQGRLIHHRLYRDACQECVPNPSAPDARVYLKDLRVLGRDLKRVILVDNSLLCFACQLDSGILCNPFKGDKHDAELLAILEVLTIVRQNRDLDVRRLFRKMYGLADIVLEYTRRGGRNGVRNIPFDDRLLDSLTSSPGPIKPLRASVVASEFSGRLAPPTIQLSREDSEVCVESPYPISGRHTESGAPNIHTSKGCPESSFDRLRTASVLRE